MLHRDLVLEYSSTTEHSYIAQTEVSVPAAEKGKARCKLANLLNVNLTGPVAVVTKRRNTGSSKTTSPCFGTI